jgi:hypothetical protein
MNFWELLPGYGIAGVKKNILELMHENASGASDPFFIICAAIK